MTAGTKTQKGKKQKPPKRTRGELIEEALDYHKQGYSIAEIAGAMGLILADAKALINEGLEMIAAGLPDNRMAILTEIARLQDAQKSIATNVANGEPEAIRLNRTLERELAEAKVRLDPTMREIFGNAALFELGRINITTGKRKNGRPPHQPTISSVAKVEALVIAGIDEVTIAKMIPLDKRTFDKHYGYIVQLAAANVTGKLVGSAIEGATKDPRLAADLLHRRGVPGFVIPHTHASGNGNKPNGDEYNPGAGAAAAGGAREVVHRVVVEGGLPVGSTPEKPEGDNYSDVPPEEERK
jgi:hypothetical protein